MSDAACTCDPVRPEGKEWFAHQPGCQLRERLVTRLSALIEEYLCSKYGKPPAIPASEKNGDGLLDLWLAIHGD